MAVIQKIRDKYAKLAGGVIAVALIGFLLMDAGDNLRKIFSGSNYVLKVNGEKVDTKEYATRIQEYEGLYELMGNKIDDNLRAQIHNQVVNEITFEKAIAKDAASLGLTVTKEEEKDMISGPNPDPMVMQFPYFRNPQTNQFDPQQVAAFEGNKLGNSEEARKAMEQWKMMKNYIRRNRILQKYNNLFYASAYAPKFLFDRTQQEQNQFANIRFVKIPFATINDNDVKVSDDDLKKYLREHAAQYTIYDPTRSIDYISFPIQPSADDTAKALATLQGIKSEFETTTDNESFVNRNSDESYKGDFVTKKSLMSAYADTILALPVGAVYGPYFENGNYKLTKVLAKQSLPDSVKLRHILVKTEDRGQEVLADSIAKKRIDSAVTAINAGANFAEMVTKYSDDAGSKNTAGEYEFTLSQRAQISKEFADFVFEGKTGEKKTVKVDNDAYAGYHYIEIINQKDIQQAAKLAVITEALAASEATNNAAYSKASEFAGKNAKAKDFDAAVKKDGLNKLQAQNIKVNDFVIPGIGPSREIIRWAYEATVGDVSSVFTLEDKYIVAKLGSVQSAGLMKLDESNRQMLESAVRSEMKASKIVDKYKNLKSLDALAQSAAQPIQNADSFNAASAFIPSLGFEPKVVGYAFNEKFLPNQLSPGIKGQDGVYFISVVNRFQKPMPPNDPTQLKQQQKMMSQQVKQSYGMLQEMVRRKADISYSAENLY